MVSVLLHASPFDLEAGDGLILGLATLGGGSAFRPKATFAAGVNTGFRVLACPVVLKYGMVWF